MIIVMMMMTTMMIMMMMMKPRHRSTFLARLFCRHCRLEKKVLQEILIIENIFFTINILIIVVIIMII